MERNTEDREAQRVQIQGGEMMKAYCIIEQCTERFKGEHNVHFIISEYIKKPKKRAKVGRG